MTRLLRDWWPALLWTAILFGLSSRPTLPVDLGGGLDKVAHFGAYAFLGLLLAHGQARSGIALLWAVAAGMLIGALDEFYQG
ncbi:MAG TPA: VanZ family protein, partial [Longimicrobiaceae bacterium]|nr:VanZ family protein [Longimicrobiaceae bacterium]